MTTPNPIPPHVVEKWRAEFESLINRDPDQQHCLKRYEDGYDSITTDDKWQGFLLARSTVLIELPEYAITDSAYDLSRDEVVSAIESQGYRVKGEG